MPLLRGIANDMVLSDAGASVGDLGLTLVPALGSKRRLTMVASAWSWSFSMLAMAPGRVSGSCPCFCALGMALL